MAKNCEQFGMGAKNKHLRVAFIAGGLGKGGAEKQFVYMLRALQQHEVHTMVLSLTRGEYYEQSLAGLGVEIIHIPSMNPAARIQAIHQAVATFKPHFIQATHFYTSFYAAVAGWLIRSISIGAVRNDLYQDLQAVGRTGPFIMHMPSVFLANSYNAQLNAARLGYKTERMKVIPNVIDLEEFDSVQQNSSEDQRQQKQVQAILVARLMPVKHVERFLLALALARQQNTSIRGLVVGSGPEENRLRTVAKDLGLVQDNSVNFLGSRDDVPQLLSASNVFVLTSDREGFPNVLLEAMAASLPIISTPAGEVKSIIKDGVNGFLVPYEDPQQIALRLVELANAPELRCQIGNNGRNMVEQNYSFQHLGQHLIDFYYSVAHQQKNSTILAALSNSNKTHD